MCSSRKPRRSGASAGNCYVTPVAQSPPAQARKERSPQHPATPRRSHSHARAAAAAVEASRTHGELVCEHFPEVGLFAAEGDRRVGADTAGLVEVIGVDLGPRGAGKRLVADRFGKRGGGVHDLDEVRIEAFAADQHVALGGTHQRQHPQAHGFGIDDGKQPLEAHGRLLAPVRDRNDGREPDAHAIAGLLAAAQPLDARVHRGRVPLDLAADGLRRQRAIEDRVGLRQVEQVLDVVALGVVEEVLVPRAREHRGQRGRCPILGLEGHRVAVEVVSVELLFRPTEGHLPDVLDELLNVAHDVEEVALLAVVALVRAAFQAVNAPAPLADVLPPLHHKAFATAEREFLPDPGQQSRDPLRLHVP